MRSRYSAYVLAQAQYLLDTHHPEYRGDLTVETLAQACAETRWARLELLSTPPASQDVGYVEFKAWYYQGDRLAAMHERSRFCRDQGQWRYCDGQFDPKPAGRNAPCVCGSGKKFKRCCG
ncbi:YchJ family protein [Ferrimonas gelatinilytica]|uniref:YchJ family protein n=2 Tax=Ferrimonas gelatinilytica TaxID=1255257 RepID=A0ABP9RXP3_9GAMM